MNDENLLAADEVLREVHRALLANGNTLQAAQVRAAAMEARALRVKLDACMASRDALRDWAQECRNKVLYLLAQQDNELGRVADGLGQASAGLFGPMMRPPTPAGWSDTDWLRHLETCPPIGYAVRDSLYGTSKAGVLRFCSSDEAGAFAVYASPRPTQTEPSPATPAQAQVPLTEFRRMQIIGDEFPLALVQPIVIAKVDSVCLAIEKAHGIGA